nr:37s ribosomal protein mrp4, mitochondrial [Quercus suber]
MGVESSNGQVRRGSWAWRPESCMETLETQTSGQSSTLSLAWLISYDVLGRIALPKPPVPIRSWRRAVSTGRESQQLTPNPFDGNGHANLTAASENDGEDQVKKDWEFFQFQKAATNHLGTQIAPHYKPRDLIANPPFPRDITLELLMASQTHLGHHTSLWHPGNARYIFGIRGSEDPIHIISLDVTASHLRRACKIVRGVTERGGLVLFVGSRAGQARAVVKAAELAQGCHLFSRWVPGSITNGQQILGKCSKKVVNEFDEEVPGFEEQLHLAAAIKPDLVVCLNPMENYVLLHECGLNNIPTVGIVDTDCNPAWVTYPIPANDDSLRSVFVIVGALGRAGQQGQEVRLESAKTGKVGYRFEHGLTEPTPEERAAYEARQMQDSAQAHRYDEFEAAEQELKSNDEIVEEGMGALEGDNPSEASDIDESLLTEQNLESWKEESQKTSGWGAASSQESSPKEGQESQGLQHSDSEHFARNIDAAEQEPTVQSTLEESGIQAEYEATLPEEPQVQSVANEEAAPDLPRKATEPFSDRSSVTASATSQPHKSSPTQDDANEEAERQARETQLLEHIKHAAAKELLPATGTQENLGEEEQRAAREMQLLEHIKHAAAQELRQPPAPLTTTQIQPPPTTPSVQRSLPESSGDVEFQATTPQEQHQHQEQQQLLQEQSSPASPEPSPTDLREQALRAREQEMQQRWEEMVRRELALKDAAAQHAAQPVASRAISEPVGEVEFQSAVSAVQQDVRDAKQENGGDGDGDKKPSGEQK